LTELTLPDFTQVSRGIRQVHISHLLVFCLVVFGNAEPPPLHFDYSWSLCYISIHAAYPYLIHAWTWV